MRRARDNPFRTERVTEITYRFLDGGDSAELAARFERMGRRAALVGPQGAGKTTLQEEIAGHYEARGRQVRWLRINRETRHAAPELIAAAFASAGSDDLLLVDGAEQIGSLRWRQFLRRSHQCAGLLITTHAPGRLPTLHECRTTPRLLQDIVGVLLQDEEAISREAADALFERHRGNLRLCLRELYDRWSR
jgi:ABC-type branched-subunit amino acid transport system ATPase component